MGRRGSKSERDGGGSGSAHGRRSRRWLAALALVGVAVVLAWLQRSRHTGNAAASGVPSRVGALERAGLPPLPPGRLARPIEAVEEAYLFAARHPEVLHYVPCFCGCERHGHRSNQDCFVASRGPSGQVVAWTPHGMG